VKTSHAILLLLLLVAGGFTLGATLQPRASRWTGREPSDSLMKVLLGDSRRMFANHFFVKADITYHRGYYPSIFDQARQIEEKNSDVAHAGEQESEELEKGFLGPPTDWIDRFGRHFRPVAHTHLQGGGAREILPWLRVSADLDPHRVETYTTASYYLRKEMGKANEAEQFLQEGLRANPGSYEILFELGLLFYENDHDANRARNVWEAALRCWQQQEPGKKEPDNVMLSRIASNLGHLEAEQGNLERAVRYLETASKISPDPEGLQKQIDELKAKLPGAIRQ
jgi:tetratricopeptide (TPR) repeat protein